MKKQYSIHVILHGPSGNPWKTNEFQVFFYSLKFTKNVFMGMRTLLEYLTISK